MTSYSIELKQCPDCDCKFTVWAVASCNTFGAKFYTDGFVDGPMYDEGGALLTCPVCNRYYWEEDVHTLESMLSHQCSDDSELRSFPSAGLVRGRQYEDVLHQALWKNEAQEKYIRIRAWWSFNSAYRDHATEEFALSPEQETNLLRLLQLLSTKNSNESVIKAEVLRELGQFEECLKQLDQSFADRHLPTVDAIKKLANSKKRHVGTVERPTNIAPR